MVRIKSALDILAYGIALLGFVPLVAYLDMIPRFLFPGVFLFAVVADRRGAVLRGHLPTAVSIFFFIYYGIQFSGDNLVEPAVNLLVILLAVRLASEKGVRHYLQIYALALFALAGSSLLNLSAAFLIYLLLLLVLIAVSLVLLTFYDRHGDTAIARDGMVKVVTVAACMPLAAMPLILLF
ncbi:MAG TPA: transglutaminaseTgpA domain-containing protein, partial [Geomobilimonas sp.]|nr:transglutaminaseTgpA domain-containing protein [Geomobilimonas sp.]